MEKNIEIPVEIVCRTDRLDTAIRDMASAPAIALDTESNSLHRYPEQLCLIQIATPDKAYLIDAVLMPDLGPLKDILADHSIQKIIHGADYDLRSLDRHYGFRVCNVYDTSVAARFCGISEFGLASLTESLLGITIPKDKRIQRADWGLRPLTEEAIDYAVTDVLHLFALREALDQRLGFLNRTTWVSEECRRLEKARYTSPDPESAYLCIKGTKQFNGSSLALLKALFLFREKEALNQKRPPYFVMPNATLIYLTANPTADLSEVPGLGQTGLKRFGPALQAAIREGMSASPIYRAPAVKFEYPSKEALDLLKRLKEWRMSMGSQLSLDPSLLWPLASLERISRNPESFSDELSSEDIRRWQRDQFVSPIADILKTPV